MDTGCDQALEVCLLLGFYAEYYIDQGLGRRITREEAMAVLDQAEEAGLVHQIPNTLDPGAICNCCPECCGALRVLKMLPNAAEVATTSHFSQVNADLCNGCETCLGRCPMDAITMEADEVAHVNLERCIGCGLCINTCPTEALMLVAKPEGALGKPPFTSRFMRSSKDIESTLP